MYSDLTGLGGIVKVGDGGCGRASGGAVMFGDGVEVVVCGLHE